MATKAVKELKALDEATKGAADLLYVELVPGVTVGVLPPRMWRLSAFRVLRGGNVDAWAAECLAGTADVAKLIEANPTIEQFEAFTMRVNEAAEALGKSSE